MFHAALLVSLSILAAQPLVRQSADYELELVGKDALRVRLEAKLWLRKGDAEVKVCDAVMALSKLEVDGKPAACLVRDGAMFARVVGAGQHRLSSEGLLRIGLHARQLGVTIAALRAAATTVAFKLPSSALDVTIEPAVRTVRDEAGGRVEARLPATDEISVRWRERVAEDKGPVCFYANCEHRVTVTHAAATGRADITLDMARGGVSSLALRLRDGVSILKVTGKAVRDWQLGAGRLLVYFNGEQTESASALVQYEIPIAALPQRIELPPFHVEGAQREQGRLLVASQAGAVATLAALERVKQRESPKADVQAFTYATAPAKAAFTVEEPTKLDVRTHAEINTLVAVGDAADHGTAIIRYSIFGVPLNQLRFALPRGTTVQDVAGVDVVSTAIATERDLSVATVKLGNPRSGDYELVVRYEKLQSASATEFGLPLPTVPDAAGQVGRAGVCSVTSAEVMPVTIEHAQQIPPRQLPKRIQNYAQTPLLFGFKYSQQPKVVIAVQRHAESSTADAIVDLVESTTVLTRDGAAVTKQQYILRNRGRQFLALDFARDVSVWTLLVAGKSVKAGQGAPRQVLIPLIRSAPQGEQLMPVSAEIVWETRAEPLGKRGKIKVALPRVDAEVSVTQWGIYTPSAFKCKVKDSNVEKFNPTRQAVLLAEGAGSADHEEEFAVAMAAPSATPKPAPHRRFAKAEKAARAIAGAKLQAKAAEQLAQVQQAEPVVVDKQLSPPTPGTGADRALAHTAVAGLLAPPIDLAIDGEFHYFRKAYPNGAKEPPFVQFKYRKR